MKKCFAFATALILSAGAFAADAPKPDAKPKPTKKSPTVVFVEIRPILEKTELFLRLQANLKATEEAAANASKPKLKEFSDKRMAFQADEAKLSAEEKEARSHELKNLQQEVSEIQLKARTDLQKRQEEAKRLFQEALDEVSGALAKEFGWDAILLRSPENSLYISEAVDQTELFMQRLNARPIPSHPLVAAPAPPAAPATPAAPAASAGK